MVKRTLWHSKNPAGILKLENRKSQRLTIPSPKTNTVAMQTGAM